MKAWLSVFSAVLAAGVIVLGVQEWRARQAVQAAERHARWVADAKAFTAEVEELASARPMKGIGSYFPALRATGNQLIMANGKGEEARTVRDALGLLANTEERYAAISWPMVEHWEREVEAVGATLRAAMKDERNWDDEKLAAIKAAHARTKALFDNPPPGADMRRIDGALAEEKRAIETMNR